jgi:antirestriction protein ArdC
MSYINDTKSYDSYIEQISNLFYNAIKNNTLMWQKEWSAAQIQTNLAHNPVTKTQYKGLNSLVLELTREEKQYNSSTWLTFNQIKQLGGYVERGSKSVPIAFYTKHKLVEKENNQGEKEKVLEELKIPVFKKSSVFNLEQVRGIEKEKIEKLLSDKSYILNDNFIDISQCENILKKSNIEFIHTKGSAAAYYNMTQDKIHLPSKEQFKNEEAYYSTAFHELGHATGHESRLNRNLSSNKLDYAKEELRAEIYSYLQAKELGIGYNLQNHQSYVKSWIEVLNNDKHEIVRAVKDSLKIMKYVKTQWIDPTITKTISQAKSISQEIQHQEQKNTQSQVNQINPKTNFAQIPMNRLLEYLGFEINKAKSTQAHIVMSDGTDKVIISRGKGYIKEGKTLGVGNYVYFNPQNNKDNGTIFHFCKNRNIDIKKLVQGAEIKDYSHAIIISDSKYYDPQVLNKYNELESYNKSAAKSLSQIRKINPKIISKFDSIKIDNYKNVIFPSYTYEEVNLEKVENKVNNLYKGLTISGMNKKLIEKPLTQDRNGNKYDKPLNSLEEGKSGLSILIPNNVKFQEITQVITGENSIDNLSYAELKKIDLAKTALVSFNGSMKEEAIKAFKYLINKDLPNIKNVTAAFDNDKQGIEYDEKLKNIIKENKPNLELKIDKSNLKDWNDQLKQYKKEIGRTFANARSYEKSFTLELEK